MKKAIDKPETCRDDEWIIRELKEIVHDYELGIWS